MTDRKPLVLVDGSSYLFRAYHALPPLTTSRGEPTGALYGVLNMLIKLVKEQEPDHIAVIFDASGKTFRDEIFEEYKANRPPMPGDLRSQIAPLLEAVRALGLPLLRVPGVEADDVIGTLAAKASADGLATLVSTSDKDIAQLVTDHVKLVNTMTGTELDRQGVKNKFDVYPEQMIDYLALVGDSIDNIPGIPKVGPKTAAKWLNQYGNIENLIAHADEIKGKVGESLREHMNRLEMSAKLATIACDIKLECEPTELKRTAPDYDKLRALYERFELNSLLRQLPDAETVSKPAPSAVQTAYETVLTRDALQQWIKHLEDAPLIAFDTETTSLDYMKAELVGISFAVKPGEAAYVPVGHDYPGAPEQLELKAVLDALRPILEGDERPKLGHHLKYDAHVLANHGVQLGGMRYDSMLESYVLNSTATRHDMDSTAAHYLGIETTRYEDVAGKGAKQLTFNQVPLEEAGPYAAEDADITLRLHQKLWGELAANEKLKSLYEEIEQPLVPVLLRMEHLGVLLDKDKLKRHSKELSKKLVELEGRAHQEAGQPFNLGSPKQLQEILFERLELPVTRKTPKGQPSTAEDALQDLAESYALPRLILEHRALSKLKSTYTDKLPLQVDKRTGRVHTSYHQAVAATGRLSSSDPNLQNIPIRTPEGRRIRQAFIAPPGYRLLAADYSQIELRIMAHLSGDEGLLAAFSRGEDIHRATAAEVFGLAVGEVTAEQRRSAKAINFGLIYGMSAFGLARQLGIERGAAQEYVNLYFERYPGVKRYMDDTRKRAREQGYVETVYGRRLYLPDIKSRAHQRRQYAERSAINAPMQGTAADIIKRAMIGVDRWILESGSDARLTMQVHDELVLEVREADVEEIAANVTKIMARAASLKVPLRVEAGSGENWDEAH